VVHLLDDARVYLDVDALLRRVDAPANQGAAVGHAKVSGYQVKLWRLSRDQHRPGRTGERPRPGRRDGNAGSARGAASLVKQAVATAAYNCRCRLPPAEMHQITCRRQVGDLHGSVVVVAG
jgi:hypothetical protein